MRNARGDSWQISVDLPAALLVALYVRDAAALQHEGELALPPLEPAVPRVDVDPQQRATASQEWADWWQRLMSADSLTMTEGSMEERREMLSRDPRPATGALARLVERLFADAHAWSTERRLEHANGVNGARWSEGDAVRDFSRRKLIGHRPVRPFRLRITELPVSGSTGWRRSEQHVVVGTRFRGERIAYQKWLNEILCEIA